MPTMNFSLYSKAVGGQTYVTVILPIGVEYEDSLKAGEKFETLWMFHGGGGNSSEWSRMTSIERLALNHRLAVVMPEVGTNFYNDLPIGPQYFTYVSEELPQILRKHFPLSEKPGENYVCGLSMGGFGASKCAFNYPERYGAVGLFSTGPVNPVQLEEVISAGLERPPVPSDRHQVVFGGLDKIPGSVNDTWFVLEEAVRAGKKLPPIFNCCGTDDVLYQAYTMFREFAKDLPLDVTYWEAPGSHNWDFWDRALSEFMDWLPLKHRDYWQEWNREHSPMLASKK